MSGARSLTAHKHKAVRKTDSGAHISLAAPLIAVWQPLKIVCRRSREKPLFAFRMQSHSPSRMPTRAMSGDITPLADNLNTKIGMGRCVDHRGTINDGLAAEILSQIFRHDLRRVLSLLFVGQYAPADLVFHLPDKIVACVRIQVIPCPWCRIATFVILRGDGSVSIGPW